MRIFPASRLEGTVRVPGDKSISHRAVMLASISDGTWRLRHYAPGDDCDATIRCFRRLGVAIERDGDDVIVNGVGRRGLKGPDGPLDCGNSGTTMRLMAGILAGQRFESVLIGDESLSRRPMARVIEPLKQMGAEIRSNDGFPPLTIRGGHLKGIEYDSPVASAQLKSAVMLAGLYAEGPTRVSGCDHARDHTDRMLAAMERGMFENREIRIPGDISSAAFFLAAASCLPGSELRVEGVGINPTRAGIIEVLRGLGASVEIAGANDDAFEPAADIIVHGGGGTVRNNLLSGGMVAKVIDEIPVLAIVGTQIEGGLEVRDAAELRVKESDRISSIVGNLKRMGASVTEFKDGFRVELSQLRGAIFDSYGDHRIAMAFAVAGLLAEGETEITGSECVGVSYPGFFDQLKEVAVT